MVPSRGARIPVRARLAARVIDWPWSSTAALVDNLDDGIPATRPVLSRYPDFPALLAAGKDEEPSQRLRKAEQIGRPVGDARFLDELEGVSGRTFKRGRPGPKFKAS
ncbi:MAG: hypothetical protein V4475_11730 [Pseudomonadota bacterium]